MDSLHFSLSPVIEEFHLSLHWYNFACAIRRATTDDFVGAALGTLGRTSVLPDLAQVDECGKHHERYRATDVRH